MIQRAMLAVAYLLVGSPMQYMFKPMKVKSKVILVSGHRGLEGCEMSRIPHCLDSRLTDGSCQIHVPAALYPQEDYFSASGTHFS
jgi:hypothetical protein